MQPHRDEDDAHKRIHRFATGLLARDVATTTQFYVEHFGFKTKIEIGWFTSLGHDDPAYELSVIASEHDSVPSGFQRPTYGPAGLRRRERGGRGSAAAKGRRPDRQVRRPTSATARAMSTCTDPDGTLIDVIELIPPGADRLE